MLNALTNCISFYWPRFKPVPRLRRGPLRVIFVITSMPVGGAETLLANLITAFNNKRILPEIVCLKEPGPLGELLSQHWPVHSNLLRGKWDLRVLWRLIRIFRKQDAAAVVTVGAGDKMFWGRLAAWIAGVPTIASALHSTGWPDGVSRLNRLLTPITDAFIAVADGHADHLKSNERFPQQRVFTVRNGIDTDRFKADPIAFENIRRELGIEDTSPVFGIVAALRAEKNHAMFLRVARSVVDICSEARFMIVGDGPERQRIEAMIHDLDLTSNVIMLGTRYDTPALLAAMDGFLLCSRNEASPVSILEALACEVPVIATNVGSVAESVITNQTGYLVAVDEDQTMVQRIIDMISDGELRAQLGQRGRQIVIQSGSLHSMLKGYTELIEKLYDATTVKRQPNKVLVDRRRVSRDQVA